MRMTNEWIQPHTWIGKVDTVTTPPSVENNIEVWIDTSTKQVVVKKHQTKFANARFTSDQLYF